MADCCSNVACGVLTALGVPMAGFFILAFIGLALNIINAIEDSVTCWFRRRAHARDVSA